MLVPAYSAVLPVRNKGYPELVVIVSLPSSLRVPEAAMIKVPDVPLTVRLFPAKYNVPVVINKSCEEAFSTRADPIVTKLEVVVFRIVISASNTVVVDKVNVWLFPPPKIRGAVPPASYVLATTTFPKARRLPVFTIPSVRYSVLLTIKVSPDEIV